MKPAPAFAGFWMGGYEGADHINGAGLALDMVRSSGHLDRLEEDHRRAAQAGLRCVRESIGWRLSEDSGGAIDLSRALQVQASARRHGLQVLWTLMHYGLPADLCLYDDAMVPRLARFAAEVARVLGPGSGPHPAVFTPVNEIGFLAWAAAQPGMLHPPNNRPEGSELLEDGGLSGADAVEVGTAASASAAIAASASASASASISALATPAIAASTERSSISGYAVKRRLAQAAIGAMQAIRHRLPHARFLHVEPMVHVVAPADRPELAAQAAHVAGWQWQAWDLIAGRAEPALGGRPEWLDIVGINHYHNSQWELLTEARLDWTARDPRRKPMRALLADAWQRYGRPLIVAETSHVGAGRGDWLAEMAHEVQQARRAGVPVDGICVYPLIDRPDWHQPASWHRSGVWHVDTRHTRRDVQGLRGQGGVDGASGSVGAVVGGADDPALQRRADPQALAALKQWQQVLPPPPAAPPDPAAVPPDPAEAPRNPAEAPRNPMQAPPDHAAALLDAAEALPGEAPTPPMRVLVAISHLRWNGLRHRTRHLLEQLAGPRHGWHVIVVEPPQPSAAVRLDCIAQTPFLEHWVPYRSSPVDVAASMALEPEPEPGQLAQPQPAQEPVPSSAPQAPSSSPAQPQPDGPIHHQLHGFIRGRPSIRGFEPRPLPEDRVFGDAADPLLPSLIGRALAGRGIERPAVWVTSPAAWPLARALQPSRVFYDCDHEPAAASGLPALEAGLMAAAELVFVASPAHAAARADAAGRRLRLLPNGVDAAFFAPRRRGPAEPVGWDAEEADQISVDAGIGPHPSARGPWLGYAGAIDERFDGALLARLADARPDWQFMIVGPVLGIDARALPVRPNVHWLLPQPYRLMPDLMARWQVALLPYRREPALRRALPLKVLEALAAGLPVVATALPGLQPWAGAGVVPVAAAADGNADGAEFLRACDAALAEDPAQAARRRRVARRRLRQAGWRAAGHALAAALQETAPADTVAASDSDIRR